MMEEVIFKCTATLKATLLLLNPFRCSDVLVCASLWTEVQCDCTTFAKVSEKVAQCATQTSMDDDVIVILSTFLMRL